MEHLTAEPDVELVLAARPENVAVVRHALGGLAEALAIDEDAMADIALAVSEACSNVVVHAYDGGEGPMEIAAAGDEQRLTIVVRDRGKGIAPRPDSPGLGVGLPLMATLSDALELVTAEDGANEVHMAFPGADGTSPGT